jgi:hypothetical protein
VTSTLAALETSSGFFSGSCGLFAAIRGENRKNAEKHKTNKNKLLIIERMRIKTPRFRIGNDSNQINKGANDARVYGTHQTVSMDLASGAAPAVSED